MPVHPYPNPILLFLDNVTQGGYAASVANDVEYACYKGELMSFHLSMSQFELTADSDSP